MEQLNPSLAEFGIPRWILVPFVLYLCVIDSSQGLGNKNRTILTIGGLYASGSMTTFQNASGIIKTVNQALVYINERSQILPGYKLEVEWRDTEVS